MVRPSIVVLFLASLSFAQAPVITLNLPPDIPSDKVQVQYFMTGPFGGYGGFVPSGAGFSAYHVPTSVEGKPAREIKIVAYMPGCEFAVLDLLVPGNEERQLICEPLGSVALHGKIVPPSVASGKDAEVSIVYLADWQFKLEGIMDGSVPMYNIAKVMPDANGEFNVQLPDFGKNPATHDGSFKFTLRERKSWNTIADLAPVDPATAKTSFDLDSRSSYPATVEFVAQKH